MRENVTWRSYRALRVEPISGGTIGMRRFVLARGRMKRGSDEM
jgi:hypothetical protein